MSAFSKISLGRPSKKYTHNMSFTNNTTFDFGGVQPILTQYMEGGDSFTLNVRQFLRLAPLPLPTFGNVHLQNEFRFVPISEICPFYEALVAQQPYYGSTNKQYYPLNVPFTTNQNLVQYLCLNYCDFNVIAHDLSSSYGERHYQYLSNSVPSGKLDPSKSTDLLSLNSVLSSYWQGQYDKYGKLSVDHFEKLTFDSDQKIGDGTFGGTTTRPELNNGDTYSTITIDSADFVIKASDDYIFLFRLNSAGRRIRKVFVGCGYSLSMLDKDKVSILPLLAFYKAYFDTYAPQREVTWSSTPAYSLIKYIEDNYFVDFGNYTKDSSNVAFNMFKDFLDLLADCWYTQLDDFVSAHREKPVTVERHFISSDGMDEAQVVGNDIDSAGHELPSQQAGAGFNNLTLQMLRLVTRFVNKDSVIGGKLSDWLKVHFGSDVSNSLFKQSHIIGSSRLDAEINAVFSTSDTASTSGGDVLGAFAGAGIGKNTNTFKYTAQTYGYAIMFSCIVPESGFFQGNDASLYLIDRDTIPYPEYDSLGYEISPKNMIFDDRGIAKVITGGFGFVPRYSSLKRKRNIVNGDMSRRGSIDSYSGYYLDRIIGQSEISSVPMSDGSLLLEIHSADIPTASEEWRYPTKYPWLGNPNRIFYQSGILYKGVSFDGDELIDDNFTCDMTFDFKLTNKYKPISQSYDTYDESVDDSSIDVQQD